jgi:PPOX class probable F420-dependent enzyme
MMPDGSPQITPVWVDVEPDGRHIMINTAAGRLKLQNIGHNPHIAVSVVDTHNAYRSVIVRGSVVDAITEGADNHIDPLSQKYLGHTYQRQPGQQRVILRIKPHHVLERGIA